MKRMMNRILGTSLVSACTLASMAFLAACSGGDSDSMDLGGGASGDAGVTAVVDWEVAGVSQKGPFVTGSAVTVQELDGITLKQTGKSFKGSIKSDKGDFAIKDINLGSQYAILEASGYYRDEISGKKSSGMVTLRALTDLSNRKTVNINLLTHLEYERVMYLVNKKKMSIADAKAQAEEEVLASFAIEGDFGESEDLNIFKSGDGNAALLAVSVLLQSDVDVAGLTERMGEFSISLAEGGSWDDADTKTAIADWACDIDLKGSLTKVRKNVESWKYADTVPAFEKYVTNFWWDNYGLGVCNDKRENETKRNINKLSNLYNEYFVCEKGRWHIPGDELLSSSSIEDTPESSSSGISSSESSSSETPLSSKNDESSSSEKIESSSSSVVSSSSSEVKSSSSVYNPFVYVDPADSIRDLPSEFEFLNAYEKQGYMNFEDGKQEVWFLNSRFFTSSYERDTLAENFVNTLGSLGYIFDGVVLNDSVSCIYEDSSYVYSLHEGNDVYKIAITRVDEGGGIIGYYSMDVKVVILKDGFEELPTVDKTSLRFESDIPEELSFIQSYVSTKDLSSWNDDSLTTFWYVRNQTAYATEQLTLEYVWDTVKEEAAKDSLEILRKVLVENGFNFVKSDSVARSELNSVPSANTSDGLVRRHFYEKETSVAKYEIVAYVGTGRSLYLSSYYRYQYGYSIEIHTQYKTKPE